MKKFKYYLIKYKFIIVIALMLICLIVSIVYAESKSNVDEVVEEVENTDSKEEMIDISAEKVKVDIKGYVKKEGVYELDIGSRVIDVINKAGGLIEGANTEYINLSKKIVDEMVIIIYSNNDVEKFKETDKEIIYIEYECICPDNKNDACIKESDVVNTNGIKADKVESTKENNKEELDDKISINSASLEELMTLNGIGESKAKSIIEYRKENGEFKNLEDIMNVSGIGESAYSKIKDNIKL